MAVITPADADLLDRAARVFRRATAGPEFLESPGALAFVASDEAAVAGWCWGYHLPRPDRSSMLYLHDLEVAPTHRRQGIGRALLGTFMRAGTDAGATRMFLTTGETNTAARALYDSMGGGLATQGPTVNYWFPLT